MKKTAKKKAGDFPKDIPDERFTQPEIVRELHRIYRFDVDAFSHPRAFSAQIIGRFWTKKENALVQPWEGLRVFAQPPYSDLPACFAKAVEEWRMGGCPLSVWLVPSWTDRQWWAEHVEPFRDKPTGRGKCSVRFLPGRLTFANPRSLTFAKKNQAKFGMALISYVAEWARV